MEKPFQEFHLMHGKKLYKSYYLKWRKIEEEEEENLLSKFTRNMRHLDTSKLNCTHSGFILCVVIDVSLHILFMYAFMMTDKEK